jgi:hypothetical protein
MIDLAAMFQQYLNSDVISMSCRSAIPLVARDKTEPFQYSPTTFHVSRRQSRSHITTNEPSKRSYPREVSSQYSRDCSQLDTRRGSITASPLSGEHLDTTWIRFFYKDASSLLGPSRDCDRIRARYVETLDEATRADG